MKAEITILMDYNKLTQIAVKQIEAGENFKKPRLAQIQKSEEAYAGKVKKALKGRFNVPLPIMSGFVDTLMSKIDDAPSIVFSHTEEADTIRAKKVTSVWEFESSTTRGRWARTDRLAKKLAAFSGRAIYKYYAESTPQYKSNLEVVDYYDFICEPNGGSELENHLFLGQKNIFRTKAELKKGVEDGFYNKEQVEKLINNIGEDEAKEADDDKKERDSRLSAMGLDVKSNNYIGEPIFAMVEWCMVHNGQRYYLFFEPKTKVWIRGEKLDKIFSDNLYPFVSWATHEDPMNFWSKAPSDDIYPVSDAMRVVFNQSLDNLQKKNWNMRAYDVDMFPEPDRLRWHPDGLVPVKVSDKPISSGIYQFQVDDATGITVNLMEYLDNMLGTKSGITPAAQGAAGKGEKVGVYYGNLEQVADRLGLVNKSYSEAWAELGQRFLDGLKEHIDDDYSVKVLGEGGIKWEKILKEDLDTKFDVGIVGGSAQLQLDELKKQKRAEAVKAITLNPIMSQSVSPTWLLENVLRFGEFTEEEIRTAIDARNAGSNTSVIEAADENQKIIKGKPVKPNRGATPAHIQRHIDFAAEEDLDEDDFNKVMAHAQSEMKFAVANTARKAMQEQSQMQGQEKGFEFDRGLQVPNTQRGTEGGTNANSQLLTQNRV